MTVQHRAYTESDVLRGRIAVLEQENTKLRRMTFAAQKLLDGADFHDFTWHMAVRDFLRALAEAAK